MSVLITGAAGFIGSHLCSQFLENDKKVIGIDNFTLGNKKNLQKIIDNKNFTFLEIDICSKQFNEVLEKHSETIDEIWHLAASSDIEKGSDDYLIDMVNTFHTTINVCNFAEENNIEKIYFSSTGAVYGNHTDKVDEETFCLPISFYGVFKLASEHFLRSNYERFLKKVVVFRFANIVGSHATHGVIYDFINKLNSNPNVLNVLGDGYQQKPYMHVKDLINAMVYIKEKTDNGYHIFNVGPDDEGVLVKDIANLVVKAKSLDSEILFGVENRGWVGDIPKIRFNTNKLLETGWEPSYSSTEAIKKAISEIIREIDE